MDQQSGREHLPHVTWCPTGPLTQLPLHAAGVYVTKSGPRIYDFVVSSYTPSLSALTRCIDRSAAKLSDPSVLIVTQPDTPGLPPLPGATVEGKRLRQIFSDSQTAFSAIDGEQAMTETVKGSLGDHSWLHLACHGSQDVSTLR